eukprot:5308847-Prymnesium_polylepis.1
MWGSLNGGSRLYIRRAADALSGSWCERAELHTPIQRVRQGLGDSKRAWKAMGVIGKPRLPVLSRPVVRKSTVDVRDLKFQSGQLNVKIDRTGSLRA